MAVPLMVLSQLPDVKVCCAHSFKDVDTRKPNAILYTTPPHMQENMRHIDHWVCLVRHKPSKILYNYVVV